MKIYKAKSIDEYLASRDSELKEKITAIGIGILFTAVLIKLFL